jgi:predicted metal-dependent phosphoesterase TrpH
MSPEFRADLHVHTFYSDGTDSPFEVLHKARQAGLSGLSITDHYTIEAYTPELFSCADDLKIRLLPGVELSSEVGDTSVHILGYRIDLNRQPFRQFLAEMIERRTDRNRKILLRLQERKIPITEEELVAYAGRGVSNPTVGRPHIAALLVQKGYAATLQQAFDVYLQEGALCYVPGIKYSPKEVIDEIHRAGGKAVLAHPHFLKRGSFLRELLALPLDGIECYYGTLNKAQEAPWVEIAKEKGWIATGGSDYHGTLKPHVTIGSSWVGEATFTDLWHSD